MVNKRHTKIIISAAVVLILVAGGLIAYGTDWNDPFKKIFPAAVVGWNFITLDDVNKAYDINRRLDPVATKEMLKNDQLDKLIGWAKSEILAKKLKGRLDANTISDEKTYYVKGKTEEYNALLNNYFFGKESYFDRFVIYPSAAEATLRIKFNSDFLQNQKAYDKAADVLARIKSGEKFEDLAKLYSDDEYTGQIGGDLGFFEHGQILPELEREITVSALGEVKDKVVISRYGYHIVYPVEISMQDGKKLWHVKHILIATSGFDDWYREQSQNISVWKIK